MRKNIYLFTLMLAIGLFAVQSQTVCYAAQLGTNLVYNGDFEIWNDKAGSDPVEKEAMPDGYIPTATNLNSYSSDARSGSNAMHVNAPTSSHSRFGTAYMDLAAGNYIVKVWMKGTVLLRWVTLTKKGTGPSGTNNASNNLVVTPMGSATEVNKQVLEDWTEFTCKFNNVTVGEYNINISVAFTSDDFVLDDISMEAEVVDPADNTLSGMTLKSVSLAAPEKVPGFNPATTTYNVPLSFHYNDGIPQVTAIPNSSTASQITTQALSITSEDIADRTATVVVTAQNGSTKTYSVIFEQYKGFIAGALCKNIAGFANKSGLYAENADKLSHGEFWGDYSFRPLSSGNVYCITPQLTNGAGTLTFWRTMFQLEGSSDMIISYSTNTVDSVHLKTIASSELTADWVKETIEINNEDPTTKVKFAIRRDAAEVNFYWDDVKITPYTESSINKNKIGKSVQVYPENGSIILKGEGLYEVYAINGQLIASGDIAGSQAVPVGKGIYVVKVGTERTKIAIR